MKKIMVVILLVTLMLVTPTHAEDIDFSIYITAEDANLRVNTDAKCYTDTARTFYEQHVRTIRSKDLIYESSGIIDSTNNMSVSTNMTSTHSPASALSSVFYAENIGIGCNPLHENCSTCGSGIYADFGVDDLTLSSIAATTPTSLTHGYLMDASSRTRGVLKAGFRKTSENQTSNSVHAVRSRNATIAGLVICQRYPAGPIADGKPDFCVWSGDGVGYPIFNGNSGHNDNTTVARSYTITRK